MGHEPKGLAGRLREGDAAVAVIDAADVPVTIVLEGPVDRDARAAYHRPSSRAETIR